MKKQRTQLGALFYSQISWVVTFPEAGVVFHKQSRRPTAQQHILQLNTGENIDKASTSLSAAAKKETQKPIGNWVLWWTITDSNR
ncbi:MAG TPA: hypothetical protein IAC31_02015 [Candidatus Faecousia intestinigallinarum]|nr:hypothetical protein [Candidatus Faecousia intestinigallinarum]